ncbi:6-bladed beta-propeller [Sphingobacterium micropteri]|nr:6-bladed beta-propeller [Sphingobacterium micropteri]
MSKAKNFKYADVREYLVDTILFREPQIIYLETSIESLLKTVSKVLVADNEIFVFDNETRKICKFDMYGKIQKVLHNIGKGPREYRGIADFAVDTINKEVLVLCEFPYKIYIYDYDFNFVKEIRTQILYLELAVTEDRIYCRRAPFNDGQVNAFHVDVLDRSSGRIEKSILPVFTDKNIDYSKFTIGIGNLLTNNRRPMIAVPDRNYIYSLYEEGELEYTVNKLGFDDMTGIYNWTEADDYIFYKNDHALAVIYKEEKKLYAYKYGVFNSALNTTTNRMVTSNHENGLVCVMYADHAIKLREKINEYVEGNGKINDGNRNFLNFSAAIQEEDNPILFFYLMK